MTTADIATIQRQIAGQKCLRALASISADTINEAARTVDIAWASETPYERWYGIEILDCAPSSVRLGRLADGAALLFNHDMDDLIGVVEQVQLGTDRVCRATVRFDTSEEAEMRWQQVRNRVLRHVSVGYMVHTMVLEKESEGQSTYRVTDWEPFELSMVTVPADPSVGVGRAHGQQLPNAADQRPNPAPTVPAQPKGTRAMSDTVIDTPTTPATPTSAITTAGAASTTGAPAASRTEANDLARRDAIMELGVRYASYLTLTDISTACRTGTSVQAVQEMVMQRLATKHTDTRGAHIGMSDKETRRYSIANAVRAMLVGDWTGAGLEREASEAAAKRFGMGTKGLLLPMDVIAHRDFTVATAAEAGNFVPTDLRTDLFADVLRNRLSLGRLGATMLFGLGSNIDIPRKLTGSSLAYITEVAAASETQPGTGKLTLAPKRIGGFIEFSKQAVIQSAIAVEPMLRQDIFSEYQVQFENAAINGSGSGANPRGIRNFSGIGAVAGGTNGAQLAWSHLVNLESACANVNAEPDMGSGYLINTRTRGWTKQTLKAAAQPFIWDNGAQPLNGYRAEVTNNVPSNLVKGASGAVCSSVIFSSNWNMLVMATFGAVEILVDELSIATNGMNRLILNGYVDSGLRRVADFATMDDALTA